MELSAMETTDSSPTLMMFPTASTISVTAETPVPETKDEEETTTLPKCHPPTNPAWTIATQNYVSYPPITSIEFQLSPKKRIDRFLDIYYCGVKDPLSKRRWAFTVGSPVSYVQFVQSTYEKDAPNSRVLICPPFNDGVSTADQASFMTFLDHIEEVSNKLKLITAPLSDVSHWQAPIKYSDGLMMGVQAKVKTDLVRNAIMMNNGVVKCCLKLTCVYFANQRSGLAFELIEAHAP
jgi:hypothetical protein